jgi:hypothetical protein
LIVDKDYSFRTLRAHQHKLNLIAKFEDIKILFSGVVEGHHVLVPLGADDTFNNDIILLPDLPREGQIAALELAGLNELDAQKFSREAARNLTVLKRLLKFPQSKIEWLNPAQIDEIFPALITGRWGEGNEGDVEILETLSGEKYSNFQEKLYKWRDLPESPILQIGHTWRLTSPLDAWSNIGPFLKPKHFELLKHIFLKTFKAIDLGDSVETHGLNLGFRKPKKYSRWTKEGLVQSLILIGLYGDGLRLSTSIDAQHWVDSIVKELLKDADSQLWVSLDHEMPLIAEASPAVFLEYVNLSLISEEKAIMAMFTSKQGLLADSSDHTGLLWALEALAWIPEYLTEAAVILARIAKLKPEIKILNQPVNSLKEIFKSWHYQTLADFEQRMSAVHAVIEVDHQTGWSLLLSMLPSNHGVAHPTYSLRWRLLGKPVGLEYTYDELFKTYSAVVDLLIANFQGAEADLADLVDRSDQLYNIEDRNRLLKFVESTAGKFSGPKHLVWKELRKTLSQHRSHPTADWAMPESDLKYYEKLYHLYEPTDPLDRYLWLFDEHWPDFPEGKAKSDSASIDEQSIKVQERRRDAANYIIDNYGMEKVKELSSAVKEAWLFGQTFADIESVEIDNEDLHFFLNNGDGSVKFIQGFFAFKGRRQPAEWSLEFLKELQSKGFSPQELSKILAVLDQNIQVWSYLESDSELAQTYWKTISPFFYRLSEEEKIIGLSYLIKYKRFFTAIDEAANYLDSLPTELIVQLLTAAATDKAEEDFQPPLYDIGKLFETLENRTDIDKSTLIRLEWLYIEILDRYQTGRSPKLIHEELLKDPDFFIEVIKWVYMPKGREDAVAETTETDSERAAQIATKAYRLLREIRKVPGYQKDGTFDGEFLKKWVLKVRSLAEQADRLEVTCKLPANSDHSKVEFSTKRSAGDKKNF